jgi:hypothetical protein
MRVEPEQVLEQERVAAHARIENPDTGKPFERDQE